MSTLNQALSSLVQYGVSDELIKELQAIAETTDGQGYPLYESASIYEMRCALFCRNYARTLWEYAHFVAALEYLHSHPLGVYDLFWSQELVTRQRLSHWLETKRPADSIRVDEQGAVEALFGQRRFSVHVRRVNLMAAWTAFLALVEPDLLTHLNAFRSRLDASKVDALAEHLKKRLDHYLEPHLRPLQQQRQGRIMLTWLQNQSEDHGENEQAAATLSLLDDQSVLAFWEAHAEADEGDFRRFSTVADCAYRLHEALELGEQRESLQKTHSYQQDAQGEDAGWLLDQAVAQGEGLPGVFDGLMARQPERATDQLSRPPLAAIKFLTSKDSDFCVRLERAGSGAMALPLTFLRAQVFGLQQSRLTEDRRKNRGQRRWALTNFEDFNGMEAWVQALNDQTGKIQQTRDAIAYILFQHRAPEAIASLIRGLEAEQKESLKASVSGAAESAVAQEAVDLLEHYGAQVLSEHQRAFNRVNRVGFKELPDEASVDPYRQGEVCLAHLSEQLAEYAQKLTTRTQEQGGLAACEAADRPVFQKLFTRLYCVEGVQA